APASSLKDAWELKQKNIKAGVPRAQRTDLDASPSPSIKDARELKQKNIKAGVPRAQRTDLDASPQPLHFKDA
nr:hypothetical protein [Aeromonas salmonicida]